MQQISLIPSALMLRHAVLLTLLVAFTPVTFADDTGAVTHRLYEGMTVLLDSDGKAPLKIELAVRDINQMEPGPREVLVKLYDPTGKTIARQVIEDDGIEPVSQVPMAGWDHEAWYYAYLRQKGGMPATRWSAPSNAARLASITPRHVTLEAPVAIKGRYRLVLVGSIDHYVTIRTTPNVPRAVAGNPQWLHGHGTMYAKSYFHVPAGTTDLHLATLQHDRPVTRGFTIRDAAGEVLIQTNPGLGFTNTLVAIKDGRYDDQVLTLEVSPGADDFLLDLMLVRATEPGVRLRGRMAISAALADTPQAAAALRGGVVSHDGNIYWNHHQVALANYIKGLDPSAFEVRNDAGELVEADPRTGAYAGLAEQPDFRSVNERYWQPTLADRVMHHYQAHRKPGAINVAARDLAASLRAIGPNDHIAIGPFRNLGYEFSNYAYPVWRPAWRIIQQSDAPAELKGLIRAAIVDAADRLAFARGLARVNGNSFGQTGAALRYAVEATGDELHRQLFDTFWTRFTTGGFGERIGVGPSGSIQESFGNDHHYGSYNLNTWPAILNDLADPRFQKVYDRLRMLYSYTQSQEVTGAWSSRTSGQPQWPIETEGPFAWKGLPGPDLTEGVNGANEWFAARRKHYYAVTYHGRLTPKWIGYGFGGQIGYGGGMLSQLHIPGHGQVIASSLNGPYGKDMHLSNWRNFSLHSVVGTLADQRPVVSADSEHFNASLDGTVVTSSGTLREASITVTRTYRFDDDAIVCTVALDQSDTEPVFDMWIANAARKTLNEAYEMIPYVTPRRVTKQTPATVLSAINEAGDTVELSPEPVVVKTIVIDRGGYGVRIELESPRPVLLGANKSVLIQLIDEPTLAPKIAMTYRLVPFVTP